MDSPSTSQSANPATPLAVGLYWIRRSNLGDRTVKLRLLVAAVIVGLGCSAEPGPEMVVRLAYHHPMVTLDPHAHNHGVTGAVLSGIYEGLVTLSFGSGVEPRLASEWSTPSDTEWRFRIRDDVYFHDGQKLELDDVVTSIRRARFDKDSALSPYLQGLEDVRALPEVDRMLEIKTTSPFPLLLARLAMVAIMPSGYDPERPVGTGPYQWQSGTKEGPIQLRIWEDYWGELPDANLISLQFIEDEELLAELVQRDELDVMALVTGDYLQRNPPQPGWQVVSIPSVLTTILGLNTTKWPLSDVRVRKAIDLAIDREYIVQTSFDRDFATPAADLVPAGVIGSRSELQLRGFDLEQARSLLESAGVEPNTTLQLDCSTSSKEVQPALVSALEEIGFKVQPRILPYQDYYELLRSGDTEAYVFGWNFSRLHASDFLEAIVHSRDPNRRFGEFNAAMFSDPQLDEWIEAAIREPQSERQYLLLRRTLDRVAELRPYIPLFHPTRQALVRDPFRVDPGSVQWVAPQEIGVAN